MPSLKFPRKPKGYVEIITPDGRTEGETLQCVHCSFHWVVIPGSGRERGFCFKCMGPTCGKEKCYTCEPFEKQMERIERG